MLQRWDLCLLFRATQVKSAGMDIPIPFIESVMLTAE